MDQPSSKLHLLLRAQKQREERRMEIERQALESERLRIQQWEEDIKQKEEATALKNETLNMIIQMRDVSAQYKPKSLAEYEDATQPAPAPAPALAPPIPAPGQSIEDRRYARQWRINRIMS